MQKNNRGFSLIEISIVILIIGGLLAIALPRMNFNKVDTKKVIRGLTVSAKEVRNRAKLYGTTYRLAFRLDADNQAYWVEKSTTITYIDKAALEKARDEAKSSFRKDEKAEGKVPPQFQPDSTVFKKEQTLPRDYTFKLIESGARNVIYSDGMAYIHFFPQGFIETALIQIEDPKKNIWSITFNPITGQAAIIPEAKLLKDLEQ
ncbi:MAG: prepilin-type N-terminal cleavage/methylation domain-containing protein [Bdellovibrionaceae bacterium]|nr:prepilin-type N-terminal cleavage/methylation domain-containing protein [Pseudobdellovibrionaceae bacterium]